MQPNRQQRRVLEKDNAKQPLVLQQIPRSQWPDHPRPPKEVWRSRDYLVQIYDEAGGIERMSISSTVLRGERWLHVPTNKKYRVVMELGGTCELEGIDRRCTHATRETLESSDNWRRLP